MKKDKDHLVKGLKTYNVIMSNVWQLLTIILMGVLAGYLFQRNAIDKKFNYMAITIIVFTVIGIIVFFVNIIKASKKLAKAEKKQIAEKVENEEIKEVNDQDS